MSACEYTCITCAADAALKLATPVALFVSARSDVVEGTPITVNTSPANGWSASENPTNSSPIFRPCALGEPTSNQNNFLEEAPLTL